MQEVIKYAIVCVTIIVVSGAIITACDRSNKRTTYIKHVCIENGGTWVITNNGGTCITPKPQSSRYE